MTTITTLLSAATETLSGTSLSPALDAEVLLAFSLNKNRTYLIAHRDKQLDEKLVAKYEGLIARRSAKEPTAYITGQQEFWSLPFKVDSSVLIPRPDTECLVEYILANQPEKTDYSVLDLGTGSGAIAIAIASERPEWLVHAIDQSDAALRVAKSNAKSNKIHNVTFSQSDWFEHINEKSRFHVIVSNPPYIDQHDTHLDGDGVCCEPKSALVAGDNGLSDIRMICKHAIPYLHDNGLLAIEHGHTQAQDVREIFSQNDFLHVRSHRDYGGNDRFTTGTKP